MIQTPVRVGLVGSGFGGRVVLPCLTAARGISVTAWASRDRARIASIAQAHGVGRCVATIDELLAPNDLDLVWIATPPATHFALTVRALAAGVAVVCEKPLSTTVKEAEEVTAFAASSGRFTAVDHQLRFHPNLEQIRAIVGSGTLGRIQHVEFVYETGVRRDPALPWDWWSDMAQGGGELLAIGSHALDLLQLWFGPVRLVRGKLRTLIPERRDPVSGELRKVDSDEVVAFDIEFASGVTAEGYLSCVAEPARGFHVRVVGDEASLVLGGLDRLVLHRVGGASIEIGLPDPLAGVPIVGSNPWRTCLVRYGEHLGACLREGLPHRGATFSDATQTQRVLSAIARSSHEDRPLEIDRTPSPTKDL